MVGDPSAPVSQTPAAHHKGVIGELGNISQTAQANEEITFWQHLSQPSFDRPIFTIDLNGYAVC
jgi:hypothetical protein